MDIFQTTVTAIHEICRITIFIRRVVQEIRTYEENVSQLQAELEHEYLPDNLTRSVNNILTALNKCLAEYRIIALKHGLDLSEAELAVGLEQQIITTTPQSCSSSVAVIPVPPNGRISEGYRDKFRAIITALGQKSRAPEWALFSKIKIQALLAQYSQWTERLRQVMTLMLLVEGRVGSLSVHDIATQNAGSALGLQKPAARQLRAQSDPPADFGPLEGSFEVLDGLIGSSQRKDPHSMQLQYVVGTYIDPFGVSSTTVIMEKHKFDTFDLATTTGEQRAEVREKLVRKLVWTLKEDDESPRRLNKLSEQNATNGKPSSETTAEAEKNSHVGLLPCLGYLPIADDGYPSLIYRLPPGTTGSSICTLHDYILNCPKPALGDRFTMALSLAETVLDIHSSCWVHKGIWSRGILFMPMLGRTLLYLVGWSTARPRSQEMSDQSMGSKENSNVNKGQENRVPRQLEIELYRHPERYGTKTAGFSAKHDIYSVGIVLLEIALWTTMSKQFAGPIAKAKERGALPPVNIVADALSKLSRNVQVAQEMGEEYARLIRRCLETDFEVEKQDETESGLLGQFQCLAVDRLNVGAAM
ncbi:unnamed protein product [Penicillium palitans]